VRAEQKAAASAACVAARRGTRARSVPLPLLGSDRLRLKKKKRQPRRCETYTARRQPRRRREVEAWCREVRVWRHASPSTSTFLPASTISVADLSPVSHLSLSRPLLLYSRRRPVWETRSTACGQCGRRDRACVDNGRRDRPPSRNSSS
jgi:hypothetical protein